MFRRFFASSSNYTSWECKKHTGNMKTKVKRKLIARDVHCLGRIVAHTVPRCMVVETRKHLLFYTCHLTNGPYTRYCETLEFQCHSIFRSEMSRNRGVIGTNILFNVKCEIIYISTRDTTFPVTLSDLYYLFNDV